MSPYFQRSQNELIIEALKKDGAKDHMFLDALGPSFMVDDIGYFWWPNVYMPFVFSYIYLLISTNYFTTK